MQQVYATFRSYLPRASLNYQYRHWWPQVCNRRHQIRRSSFFLDKSSIKSPLHILRFWMCVKTLQSIHFTATWYKRDLLTVIKIYFNTADFLNCRTFFYSLVLNGCLVKSLKQIVEEDAARLAVNIITIASFPELLQVICILHYLQNQIMTFSCSFWR